MNWSGIFEQFLHNPKEPLLFHTGIFLFIFSLFLIGYSFVYQENKLRNIVIILFGFYFYYKASGVFLLLLIATISADYLFSMLMERQHNPTTRKLVLVVAIMFSLSFLLYFKYTNFFLENVAFLTGAPFSPLHLVLPIGISFYTFQSISYLVDIYSKKITRPSYSDYLMYMSFFPHLVAGPIVRARDFLPQLREKVTITKSHVSEAFFLITKGLVKKAIIADYVAQYSDAVFAQPEGFSGTENIIASLCYTLQIFCDFSGYTDMAIGVALLMGFRLCLNFDSPYKSLNITEFWRKWHISLSSWLRDYIYIPFGGNKKGFAAQLLFLLLTMLIGGFWHGPSWKFVFWGAGHGILLILHKLFTKAWPDPRAERAKSAHGDLHEKAQGHVPEHRKLTLRTALNPLFWLITFVCVSLLWVPFRAESMTVAMSMYRQMATGFDWAILEKALELNGLLYVFLAIGYLATMQPDRVKNAVRRGYDAMPLVFKIVVLVLLIQAFIQVRSESVQPFIYFEF
jgi:alginate O-acetyltransferase complex protein AlgI